VGVARAKRRVERDIGRPFGRRHSVIEENAEHPIAEPGQPIVDGCTIPVPLVARLDHQDRAVPLENGGRSVEHLSFVSLDVDLD
jgi:ribosome assembly protein YihI (activator of Der GTPase)